MSRLDVSRGWGLNIQIGGNKRMDTREIFLTFEIDEDVDGEALAKEVQEHLMTMQSVTKAEADVETFRLTGIEVAGAIGVGILVVRGTRELIEELNLLIPQLARMVHEMKGLRAAFVEVDGEKVPIDELDEGKIGKIVQSQS
jgi:hypothetical protein